MRNKVFWVFIVLVLTGTGLLFMGTAVTRAAESIHLGHVESRPDGNIGVWVIGGESFVADTATTFDETQGPLTVGACAEVEYTTANDTNLATHIESKHADDCGSGGDGDPMQVYGYLDSFPADLIGDWVVAGITYTADSQTQFVQEHGPFAVGVCVEVQFVSTTYLATRIQTESDYKCAGGDDGGHSQAYGILDSFPVDLVGNWVVDGITYTADIHTQFEQESGPFFVGTCVEVKYDAATFYAAEIGTAGGDDCAGSGDPEQKFYGLIEVIPAEVTGTWTIGGVEFVGTAATELEEEHGQLVVGACAEVEYVSNGSVNTATKIGTESPYHCNGGSYINTAYGIVNSFPDTLYGTWVISGTSYIASPDTTQFEQEDGSFAVGVCVKVQYFTTDGLHQAVKIETKDQGCTGGSLPALSKVYATIDSFPPEPYLGTWEIGGSVYSATVTTAFEQESGPFAIGTCVEAKYNTTPDGNLLTSVETKQAYKCQGNDGDEFHAYGAIEILPDTTDLIGTWQVSGITYEVDAATFLNQEHGFFTLGAYVEVQYVVSDTVRLATKIETHVEPDHGVATVVGTLESFDSTDDWGNWVIDGVTYQADPAIEVGSGTRAPQVGRLVWVNTYEQAGMPVITSVSGPGFMLLLPILVK